MSFCVVLFVYVVWYIENFIEKKCTTLFAGVVGFNIRFTFLMFYTKKNRYDVNKQHCNFKDKSILLTIHEPIDIELLVHSFV